MISYIAVTKIICVNHSQKRYQELSKMEFAAEVSSSTNIYNTLCGDTVTTFTKEEIAFNGIYNDVRQFSDDREEQKKNLAVGYDRAVKLEHPSKDFILSGGLRRVVLERAVQERVKYVKHGHQDQNQFKYQNVIIDPGTVQVQRHGYQDQVEPQITPLQNLQEYQPLKIKNQKTLGYTKTH